MQGLLGLSRLAVSFFFKDELNIQPTELALLTGIALSPWVVKPLYERTHSNSHYITNHPFPAMAFCQTPSRSLATAAAPTSRCAASWAPGPGWRWRSACTAWRARSRPSFSAASALHAATSSSTASSWSAAGNARSPRRAPCNRCAGRFRAWVALPRPTFRAGRWSSTARGPCLQPRRCFRCSCLWPRCASSSRELAQRLSVQGRAPNQTHRQTRYAVML